MLNEELKKQKTDSALLKEFHHEKIFIGQGVSYKKKKIIQSFLSDRNMPFQNLQSHPFNIK